MTLATSGALRQAAGVRCTRQARAVHGDVRYESRYAPSSAAHPGANEIVEVFCGVRGDSL